MTSPEPVPPQAITVERERTITAVALALKTGHARFGVRLTANDRRALAAEVVEAAAPHLVAGPAHPYNAEYVAGANDGTKAERERCAQLMDLVHAHYGCYVGIEGSHGYVVTSGLRPAGALLRQGADGGAP